MVGQAEPLLQRHSPSPLPLERALGCESCGQVTYPTVSPAVSVAITQGDRLLMARNARGAFHHFSLIAGYVEPGESLEDTVHREVMEEVGLRVKNLRYVGSQPWGLSQSLMVGFHAGWGGGSPQESELAEARWFHRSEIAPQPPQLSFSDQAPGWNAVLRRGTDMHVNIIIVLTKARC